MEVVIALLYLKALHIIFVVTWFTGLFYIVRLFVYHREALDRPKSEREILIGQYSLMEKRLWYGITWPSAIFAMLFGLGLIHPFFPLANHPWLMVKLAFIVGLFLYHLLCGKILKEFKKENYKWTSSGLRVLNEVATLFLFAIVFLVILKSTVNFLYGIFAFIVLSILLFLGIKGYQKARAS